MNENLSEVRVSVNSYTNVAIFFHWSIALLIIANIVTGVNNHYNLLNFSYGMMFHKQSGVIILFLVILRVIWRLTHRYPSLNGEIPKSEQVLANFSHFLIYLLMIVVPSCGILFLNSIGKDVYFLNIKLPPVIVKYSGEFSDKLLQIHQSLAIFLSLLIVGHIIAALKHHFIDKNQVLRRMLPTRNKSK